MAALKNRVAVSPSGAVSYSGFESVKEEAKSLEATSKKHLEELDEELNLPGFKKEITRIVLLAALIIGFQLALKFSNLTILK